MIDINLVQFIETHSRPLSNLVNILSFAILIFSFVQSRKIVRLKKEAEKVFVNAIILDGELLNKFKSIQDIDDYRTASDELIKSQVQILRRLNSLNDDIVVQIKPALSQASLENRKAYLMKLAKQVNNLAKS